MFLVINIIMVMMVSIWITCGMLVAVVWLMAPSITDVCTSRSWKICSSIGQVYHYLLHAHLCMESSCNFFLTMTSNSFSKLSINVEIFSRFIDFMAADIPFTTPWQNVFYLLYISTKGICSCCYLHWLHDLSRGDGWLNPAGHSVHPGGHSQEVERLVLLTDGVLGMDPRHLERL